MTHGLVIPRLLILPALMLLAVAGLTSRPASASGAGPDRIATEPVRVVVTIPPLLWPVRELLGTGEDSLPARVTLILRPGLSEHGFELTASQVEDVARADVVVMAGHGLEPRIAALASRTSRDGAARQVVSFEGLIEALHASGDHSACGHDHGEDHGAGHGAASHPDPHMWLDPVLMRGFVGRVEAALVSAVERRLSGESERAAAVEPLRRRAEAARRACDEIDREHRDALEPLRGRAIVTHHNAWAYLCARYGLTVAAVVRPIESVEPTPGDVMLAVKAIRDQKAGAVFVEPQFPGGVAERIARTARVRLEKLDPLGDGDWAGLMRTNLAALVRGLSDAPDAAMARPQPIGR